MPLSRQLLATLAAEARPHSMQVLSALLVTSVEGACGCCNGQFGFNVISELLLARSTAGPLPVRVLQGAPRHRAACFASACVLGSASPSCQRWA